MQNKLLKLEQAPIIKYDLDFIAINVAKRIDDLNLQNLEIDESTIKTAKTIRAELNNEFKEFEQARKFIKDAVLKPYQEFEDKYKTKIASCYNEASNLLKTKIDEVEDKLLQKKITVHKEYCDAMLVKNNLQDSFNFEDFDIKIIKSRNDKDIKDDIDLKISKVLTDINTINTLANKERVLAKYYICKDINQAIGEVNIEIEKEAKIIEKAKEEVETKAQDALISTETAQISTKDENSNINSLEEQMPLKTPLNEDLEKIGTVKFCVTGTRKQVIKLINFMKEEGLKYENIK